MRIASLVRRTLGLKGHRVEKVSEEDGQIVVRLAARKRSRPICSSCGRKMPGYDTLAERSWRHVPIWGTPVTLLYRPRRGNCKRCGITVEAMPWSRGKSLSLPLIVVLATYAKILAWSEVARLCGVHWNTVRAAVKSAVEYGLASRETTSVIAVGIDEISRRKGHKYVTMVYDLNRMRLLWCGEGRDKEALKSFLSEWGQDRCAAIKAVCLDMWQPYIDVIEEMLPGSVMVFDKFHIIRHLMEAVDEVRREEARRLAGEGKGDLLKKTRYIWLKNPENLTAKQRLRLSDPEKLKPPDQPRLPAEGGFQALLGLYLPEECREVPGWLVLVGHPLQARAHEELRLDGQKAPGGDTQLLQDAAHQCFRRGDEPQGQGGEPKGLWVQDGWHLPACALSCARAPTDAGNDPQILVRSPNPFSNG